MSLSPEELRAKFMRKYPDKDVIYSNSPNGGEVLWVLPAGSIKELAAENKRLMDRLRSQMPQHIDLDAAMRRAAARAEAAAEDTLVIVIESEPK